MICLHVKIRNLIDKRVIKVQKYYSLLNRYHVLYLFSEYSLFNPHLCKFCWFIFWPFVILISDSNFTLESSNLLPKLQLSGFTPFPFLWKLFFSRISLLLWVWRQLCCIIVWIIVLISWCLLVLTSWSWNRQTYQPPTPHPPSPISSQRVLIA